MRKQGSSVRTGPVYGIIFDLMGTLATFTGTRQELHAAWQQGARELYRHLRATGVDIAPDDFAHALQATFEADLARNGGNPRELSVASVMTRVLDGFGYHLTPEESEAAQRAYFQPELNSWHILPGVLESVETLNAEGFRLAVVSNAPSHQFVEEAVAKIGLRPFFSPVMSSALAGARKPDPGLFLAIATAWELNPSTIVVVGDGILADIEGAHAAGMRGVLVHRAMNASNTDADEAIVPDADLAEIAAVPALLARWQAAATSEDHRPETGFIEDY